MKPGLLVRWTRQKQLKDNKAHFAAKNLQYSVDVQRDLNYMGDGSPFHTMDIYGPKGSDAVLPVILLIHGGGYVSCEKIHQRGAGRVPGTGGRARGERELFAAARGRFL